MPTCTHCLLPISQHLTMGLCRDESGNRFTGNAGYVFGAKPMCLRCGHQPVREALADEHGMQKTIGLLTCQACSGEIHQWGCNDPAPHKTPDDCTRRSG